MNSTMGNWTDCNDYVSDKRVLTLVSLFGTIAVHAMNFFGKSDCNTVLAVIVRICLRSGPSSGMSHIKGLRFLLLKALLSFGVKVPPKFEMNRLNMLVTHSSCVWKAPLDLSPVSWGPFKKYDLNGVTVKESVQGNFENIMWDSGCFYQRIDNNPIVIVRAEFFWGEVFSFKTIKHHSEHFSSDDNNSLFVSTKDIFI